MAAAKAGRSSGKVKPGKPPRAKDLRAVALLIFDFDGVMTDNRVLVMEDGREGVFCNRSDGLGVGMAATLGLPMLVMSKEQNPVVAARCRKLRLDCRQGIDDKPAELAKLCEERGIDVQRVAYVGNDVNDVACMKMVGLPIAVADAYPPALRAARAVTQRTGGHGAVREVIDWFLESGWTAGGAA